MEAPSQTSFDPQTIIRWLLFLIVMVSLSMVNLLVVFRGISSPQAMDQAQIAREIARGEGFSTKMIRPLELHLAEAHSESPLPLTQVQDTYQSPLYPLVLGSIFKLIGADKPDSWQLSANAQIFPLDRIIALISTLFFVMAIGVAYLLLSHIFDNKIAGFAAVLMLLCNLFWEFSQSGLPQMLLLLLFTCGAYFSYRAIEVQDEGRSPMGQILTASVFFTLMVLTHWITLWIFLGFLLFVAVAFRPRGVHALTALGVLLLGVAYPVIRMIQLTGQPFGVARFVFYNGLAAGSESAVMRTLDLGSTRLELDGLLIKILGTTLTQATHLIPLLGGILAAPIFFIALLHPFKRPSIAKFRWLIALMWLFAALGMAIFGIDSATATHPNQIHLLFAPIMAGYGLAMISILWNRLEVSTAAPFLRNAHLWVIVLLSAAPLMLTLPQQARIMLHFVDQGGWPQWPPYLPSVLNRNFAPLISNDPVAPEIVVSDQPWAIAWYSDRHSLWLPKSIEDFTALEAKAGDQGTRLAGILITPSSVESGDPMKVIGEYQDFAPLIFDGLAASLSDPNPATGRPRSIYDQSQSTREIARKYPNRTPMAGQRIVYYSEKNLTAPGAHN